MIHDYDSTSWLDHPHFEVSPRTRRAYLKHRSWARGAFVVLAVLAIVFGVLMGIAHS